MISGNHDLLKGIATHYRRREKLFEKQSSDTKYELNEKEAQEYVSMKETMIEEKSEFIEQQNQDIEELCTLQFIPVDCELQA
jgi:hypothetical protein